MSSALLARLTRLRQNYGTKLLRFAGVSMVNVITGQTLLYICFAHLGLFGIAANGVAVVAGSIPSYFLSRHYVWEKDKGEHKVVSEIVPFWGLAFAGLILSTLFVAIADNFYDHVLVMQAGNAAAFSLLWVVRFAVLEHLLWGDRAESQLTESST
ncbi:MAG: GtrA family protein [Actinomycetota bacterium]|nr:hypothetical protein [Actinomycetota bacterium]MEE2646762.1 GtrA family protein [Actinomycetota bacterium]|tara:strand:+ start:759 stop:1223 length:465 start_codon:yes stop_codon:yes gene_type:complete